MSGTDDTELNDAELLELLRDRGFDRRFVLRLLGAGGALTLGAGSAAASHDPPDTPHIDSHYGYASPANERLPGKLRPDHTVELYIESGPLGFHFAPMGLQIDVGDIVRFDFHSPDHTVTPYHLGHGRQQRVPGGEVPFSSPVVVPGGFWLYEFSHAGTYDLYCAPHQFFGMVMRLVVGGPDAPDYDGEFSEEGRPPIHAAELEAIPGVTNWPFPTPADVFAADAMSVANITEEGSVSRSDVLATL